MEVLRSIKKNPLPWVVQGATVLMLIINLYLANKLSPVVKDLSLLGSTVMANDQKSSLVDKSIMDRLDRIENKLDRLIEKR